MLAFLTFLLSASMISMGAAPASAASSEQEGNGSTSTANSLPLGTTITGSAKSSNYDDTDYYAVNVPTTGRLKIDLRFPSNLGTSDAYSVYVIDSGGNTRYSFDVQANQGSGTALASQGIYMPKGTAYIKIYGDNDWPTWGKTYTLNVTQIAGNAETESNDSTETPTRLPLGTAFSGSTLSDNYDDTDYYAVNVPTTGRLKIDLRFPSNLGTSDAYSVYVIDSGGNTRYSFDVQANQGSGTALASQGIYMPKGTAYIKIYGDNDWPTWGKTYTLNVTQIAGNAETESNDSTETPTRLPLGTAFSGSTLSDNYDDTDYYAVDMPAAGRIELDFRFPANLGTGSLYDMEIINSAGDELYSYTSYNYESDGSWFRKQSISLAKGRSYIRIYGDNDWPSWGKTYKIKATALLATTPTPTFTGTVKVGSTLTAGTGTWSPAPVTKKYQWLRDGKAISGATKSTYVLTTSDAGKKISVRVTGSKTGYKSISKTSAAKTVPLLNLTSTPIPTVNGTARVGSTLKATPGTWRPGTVKLRYQWLRNGAVISNATASSYRLTTSDAGQKVSVRVTGSKTGYKSVSKISAAKSIPLLTLTSTPTPKVSGTSKVGYTLKASAGTWAPGTVKLRYQWQRNGVNIAGATSTSYKLTLNDAGKKITVKVTGSKTGYKSVSKISAAKSIPLLTLTSTPTPKVSGTSKVGYTLKASAGTWAPGTVKLRYQWQRNGVNIAGATSTTYKLTRTDRGKKVTVKVTGSRTGYKSVSKISAYRLIK